MNVEATLIAHRGTNRVTEDEVREEPCPPFTSTWHPYSHAAVLDAMGSAVADAGFTIERREYSMSPMDKMFAVWEINKANEELRFAIGIRNSIAKSMAVGLCAGERVFVCDNMVFSSEFILFRKHTGWLDEDELILMAREAVAAVIPNWSRIQAWHERMKSIELDIRTESMITVAAMRKGIISPAHFADWNDLYHGRGDVLAKYTPTLHGWHGATTELLNGLALYRNAARQTQLNAFIDHEVPVILDAAVGSKSITFHDIETDAFYRERDARAAAKITAREHRTAFAAKVREHRRVVRGSESGRPARAAVIATPVDGQLVADRDFRQGDPVVLADHPGAHPETDKAFADRTGMTDIARELDRRRKAAKRERRFGTVVDKDNKPVRAAKQPAMTAFDKQLKAAGRRMNVINVPGIGPVGFTTPDPETKKS